MDSWFLQCDKCGERTRNLLLNTCDKCGGVLSVVINKKFDRSLIRKNDFSMWRYKAFYPYITKEISLGEGWTPLIKFEDKTYLKLDYLNPTGSFKDRGASALISAVTPILRNEDVVIAEDSSGNAGAAVAAYSAYAGLKARIYVSKSASRFKRFQIVMYGAEIVEVDGSREDVFREATTPSEDKFYLGHRYNPIFRDGFRTLAYEILEQLNWELPKTVFVPVSAGTLLLGLIDGFKHLYSSGTISEFPEIVACQAERVSPLYHKFYGKQYNQPGSITTIADALASLNPPLLDLMIKSLKEINGRVELASEGEIEEAYFDLAKRGIFVEPSSALVWAVSKNSDYEKPAVLVLTGFGLKSLQDQLIRKLVNHNPNARELKI